MEPSELLASTVDKSQVPPLHQKRVVAFINHFIISTCSFLNDFANQCETKFIDIERKMQRLEVALSIIESKLASIPDENFTVKPTTNSTQKPIETKESPAEAATEEDQATITSSTAEPVRAVHRACEDVRYKTYFNMVRLGVPPDAVKQKMQTEGFDPSILDTPNLELPDNVES